MKVVFLDYDGVLIHQDCSWFFRVPGEGMQADPACVRWVNEICRETGAKIVISSAHRGRRALGRNRKQLQAWGLKNARRRVVGTTGRIRANGRRGRRRARAMEILEWLDAHPEVTDFVIIDDDPISYRPLLPRLVHVKFGWQSGGLRMVHAERAVKLLGGELYARPAKL